MGRRYDPGGISRETQRSFNKAAKAIKLAERQMKKRLPSGLRLIAEEIMTDVKASRSGKGVPVDEGTLRASGQVTSLGPAVLLSFGNAAVSYALVQHERTDYNHRVGEPRYLVRGMERWRPGGSSAVQAIKQQGAEAIRAARKAAGYPTGMGVRRGRGGGRSVRR